MRKLADAISSLYEKNPKLFIAVGVLVILLEIGLFYFLFIKQSFVKTQQVPEPPVEEEQIVLEEGKYLSVLLLGHGGAGHEGGSLMDSIILLSIIPEEKKAVMVSIPRDLYVELPTDYDNTTRHKINEAYSLGIDGVRYPNKKPEFKGEAGGWALTKYAASVVTGISSKYFVAVDFGGFKEAIETLGGVEVNVPEAYNDYFYPVRGKELELCGKNPEEITELHGKYSGFELEKQFACRYEHIQFNKGMNKMDGETALKYVRSRHGDGDFGRSKRQFVLLGAIKDKLISLKALSSGNKLLAGLVESTRTDIDLDRIKPLLDFVGNPDDYEVVQVHLTEENVLVSGKGPQGQYILYPRQGVGNWVGVRNFVAKNF